MQVLEMNDTGLAGRLGDAEGSSSWEGGSGQSGELWEPWWEKGLGPVGKHMGSLEEDEKLWCQA